MANPTFVFTGTVLRRIAATGGRAGDRMFAVKVDKLLEAPGHLGDLAGQTIDVRVTSGRLSVGDEMLFHAVPLTFGDTVVVESMGHEAVASSQMTQSPPPADPAARKAAADLEERFADADVVVSGRVAAVNDPRETGPMTEHAPQWRDAVVEVKDVHKGRPTTRTLTVRFPESADVRWYEAPKFQAGQEGVFLLHADVKGGRGKTRTKIYTALHPADFQPSGRADEVKRIAGAQNAPRSSRHAKEKRVD